MFAAGHLAHDAFGVGSFIVCLPVFYFLLWTSHRLKAPVTTRMDKACCFCGLFTFLVLVKVYEVLQRRFTKARLRLRLHEIVCTKSLGRLSISGRIDNRMKSKKKRRRMMLKKPPRAVSPRSWKYSVLFNFAFIFVCLMPMVRAARSMRSGNSSGAESVAAAAAGALLAGAAQQLQDSDEGEITLSVVSPTLPDTETKLDLPADKTNYIYTRKEFIELLLVHGSSKSVTKTRLINVIDAWAKEMRVRNNLKKGTQKFGPSSSSLKGFFKVAKTTVDCYTEEMISELLADFEVGSEEWLQRVKLIANCKCHSPGTEDYIYSIFNYIAATPCVTPDNTDQTFSFADDNEEVIPEGVRVSPCSSVQSEQFTFSAPAEAKQDWNKGRWSNEELAFAERLISEFETGLIPVPTGTSVTEFLQAALHCNDNKRISQKLGKDHGLRAIKPFVRNPTWYKMTDSDIEMKISELKGLEESFLKANFVNRSQAPPGPIFGCLLENTFDPNSPLRSQLAVAHSEFSSVTTDTGLIGNLWKLLRKYVTGDNVVESTPITIETSDDEISNGSSEDDEGEEDAEHASTTNDKPRQSRKRRQGRERTSAAATRAKSKTVLNDYDTLNSAASYLDFDASPRISRGGNGIEVEVHKKKLPSEDMRWQILYFTQEVMIEAEVEPRMRKTVQSLVAKLLFYDHGYTRVKGISTMDSKWRRALDESFVNGTTQDHPLRAKYKGRKSLVAKIELEHPGLMLKLFRKAQKTIGNQATFSELASTMKKLAKTDPMGCHDIPLSRGIVYRWFRDIGGKEKSPKPKPYLTDDQKQGRKLWCEEEKQRMEDEGDDYYACFLDEKWFYTQSLRRKIKFLPAMAGEEGVVYEVPRTISRRNVAKVMYLGVVANPIPDKNFDGKIFLKRISEMREYKRASTNQNFSDCAVVNAQLKRGEWHMVVTDGMTLGDLRDVLEYQYNLEDHIVDRLALRFYVPGKDEDSHKCMYIENENDSIPHVDRLSLGGYTLMVKYDKGDEREVDVSCDSRFMEDTMPEVGKAVREAYHWVDENIPIYLYLDNAGGHGTNEVVERYVKLLENKYNVICVHQRPRSPETNMLDLGVWMALQNVVERLHYKRRHSADALARTVEKAWYDLEEIKLSNVFRRWKFVLDLIIEDEGDNLKVESKRGKLFRAPSDEAETIDVAETNDAADDAVDDEAVGGRDALADEDEDEAAETFDRDAEYTDPLDCWEDATGDELTSKCCAKSSCRMSDLPLASTHKCLNCCGIMHGICGVEWDELSSNGFDIRKSSLSSQGQQFLNAQHTMNEICLECCENLTK